MIVSRKMVSWSETAGLIASIEEHELLVCIFVFAHSSQLPHTWPALKVACALASLKQTRLVTPASSYSI